MISWPGGGLILQSANGSLRLWLLSTGTQFQNVSNTTAGTAAMTASTTATRQAMQSGSMIPAATLMAGSPLTAATLLTPSTAPQTGMPTAGPSTFTQSAWQTTDSVARGDLALVVGIRKHGTLGYTLVETIPVNSSSH